MSDVPAPIKDLISDADIPEAKLGELPSLVIAETELFVIVICEPLVLAIDIPVPPVSVISSLSEPPAVCANLIAVVPEGTSKSYALPVIVVNENVPSPSEVNA